jgi:WD40 repeat protein
VASGDGGLYVWDAANREPARELAKPLFDLEQRVTIHYTMRKRLQDQDEDQVEWFTGLAWLEGGERLAAVAVSGRATVFDVATGESQELLAVENPLWAVAASADGKAVLCGDSTGRVYRQSLAAEAAQDRLVAATEPAGVTVIRWHSPLAAWVVGDAAGRVQVLDAVNLETVAFVEIQGPIWSLDAVTHNQVTRIAASGGEGRLAVFRFEPETRRLSLSESLFWPQTENRNQALHAVRFDSQGERIWAVGSDGNLGEWDVERQRLQWSSRAVIVDSRRRDLERQLTAQEAAEELPIPFRRIGAAVFDVAPDSLATAGDDGLLLFWNVPRQGDALRWGTTVHDRLIGPKARLVFSPTQQEHLWTLNRDGQLVLVDAATGHVLASRDKVHSGMAADLAALHGGVVTAGGDAELRFWQFAKGKLVSARAAIQHDRALISVAATADGRWLAAMDDNSGLGVWETATGKRQFFEQLPSIPGQPYTGRISFHPSGDWLAAFGAGQSGYVFTCREEAGRFFVRRLPDQINVAGMNGGVAMAWNPAWPDRLVYSDDHPRFGIRSFGETASERESGALVHNTVVDMTPTPDGRRVLRVDRDGLLVSLDARHELTMVELSSSLRNVCGLAIDCAGQRVAIANDEGTVEFWHTSAPRRSSLSEPIDATAQWTSTDWLNRDSAVTNIAPRTLRFDTQGKVRFLATETHPGDFRSDGALYFVAEDERQLTRERITVGNPEFDRRMDAGACGLFLHDDKPMVVFRCRTAEKTAYDGVFYSACRTKPGVWETEQIHAHGNLGFYPAMMVDAEGRLTEVFHFLFGGYYLIRSYRVEDDWDYEIIGEQGDGLHLESWSKGDTLHILTRTNRFNSDPANSVYLQWKRGKAEVLRERLPAALDYAQRITVLPNGQPVVVQSRQESDATKRLVVRTENGWTKHQRLPAGLDVRDWEIGPDGATYVVTWQDQQEQLVVWRGEADKWSGQIVAKDLPAAPNWIAIRFDPQGRPVVAAGILGEPFSWLKAFRLTHKKWDWLRAETAKTLGKSAVAKVPVPIFPEVDLVVVVDVVDHRPQLRRRRRRPTPARRLRATSSVWPPANAICMSYGPMFRPAWSTGTWSSPSRRTGPEPAARRRRRPRWSGRPAADSADQPRTVVDRSGLVQVNAGP